MGAVQAPRFDAWSEAKTRALNDWQKDELKKKWGTMQTVLSPKSRIERVVGDIVFDFSVKPRLSSERGNAILVATCSIRSRTPSPFTALSWITALAGQTLKFCCRIV